MSSARQSGDSHRAKYSVVSLTKYIPFTGIAHAGGEYLQSHIDALTQIANVEMLAPATPQNTDAIQKSDPNLHVSFLRTGWPRLKGAWFRLLQIEATLAGCSIYWPVRRLFGGSKAPWVQLKNADAVELQWSEMITLAPLIRRRIPTALLVGIAHDICSQRWKREVSQAPNFLRRGLARLIERRTRRRESLSFAALDLLIVFSEKDAALAKAIAPSTSIEVVHPGFKPKSETRKPDVEAPMVLFVGAMNRPENESAALWFLENVWALITREIPKARFVIAGANPSQRLQAAVARARNAEYTGFVDSLSPLYERANVCVVPLHMGAGVKFKTIDAMLAGVPVITTTVGAEGIDAQHLFAGLSDNAEGFAQMTIDTLTNPNTTRTEEARQWAESTYGEAAFAARLDEVYEDILSG